MATVKRCTISQTQVEHELDQAIKSADLVRTESFQKLHRVRTIKMKNQERERARLTKKLGRTHPRVQALQTKIDNNKALARNLQVETIRTQTEAPVVDKDSWVVHGRVFNNQLKPVPGVKVALYDRSDCPIQTCGCEYTDKTGYFKLTIKNVADDTKAARAKTEPIAGFLYVLDKNNVTVHKDKRLLPIKAGQVQYQEIILDDEDLPDVDKPPQPKTRYLGNSNTRELHDLKNRKPTCQIDEIRVDHQINFKTQKEALALGYDFCAYCFGKDKSKR